MKLVQFEGCSFTKICDFIGMADASIDGTVLTVGPQTSVIVE